MDPLTMGAIGALIEFAPQLVRWISGSNKAGDVAEVAVDIAKKVTGTDSADKAVAAMKADPQLVFQYQQAVMQNDTALQEAYLADIDSARKMQIAALQQDDVFSKRFIYYFAIGWSLFAGIYFMSVTFGTIPEHGVRAADTILGVLIGTVITGFFSFFYGSSVRSRTKDDTISTLAAKGK